MPVVDGIKLSTPNQTRAAIALCGMVSGWSRADIRGTWQ
jgi:hypothetical protein